MTTGYDVVVVGAGTAGCVLASRLSADPGRRVLLIEAGRRLTEPVIHRPGAWPLARLTEANWGENTVTQASTGTSIPLARGRGLGGSSAINAMAFIRGHRSSYDRWVDEGASGWGFDDLLPFFKRSETAPRRDPALRGSGGPLYLAPALAPNDWLRACSAAAAACGHPAASDICGGLEEGFGALDNNIVGGARQSAADAYLTGDMLSRPNLTVLPDAVVGRLRWAHGRCVGLDYRTGSGRSGTVGCLGEVVLCAGAVGSAALLMRSGVGPAGNLRALDIPVHGELAGVGANLHDHPVSPLIYRPGARGAPPGRANHAELVGLVRTCFAHGAPDVQVLFVDLPIPPPGFASVPAGFTIRPSIMNPISRGTVRLATADPATPPLIDPNYYADPLDVARMREGLRMARAIGEAAALAPWRGVELLPGPDIRDDHQLDDYVRRSLGSYSHPVGTCRMGTDSASVVDLRLRVHGVSGVRVADASIMPSIISANTNATVYAIAERAATMLTS